MVLKETKEVRVQQGREEWVEANKVCADIHHECWSSLELRRDTLRQNIARWVAGDRRGAGAYPDAPAGEADRRRKKEEDITYISHPRCLQVRRPPLYTICYIQCVVRPIYLVCTRTLRNEYIHRNA